MTKSNFLFYGNDIELLKKGISNLKESAVVYCISKSADLYMDEDLKKMENVICLPYDLERQISVQELWEVGSTINNLLKKMKINRSRYLYELVASVGLGGTAYFNTYLHALKIFDNVINQYEIGTVFCEKVQGSLEMMALKDTAHNMRVKLRLVRAKNIRKKPVTLNEMKHRLYLLCCRTPIINKMVSIDTHIRLIYRWKKSTHVRVDSTECSMQKYDIVLLMDSEHDTDITREVENLELEGIERKFKYCIFCYGVYEAENKLMQLGKVVESVENYFDFKAALKDYRGYLRDLFVIAKNIKRMDAIYFRNTNVTKAICRIYMDYLFNIVFFHAIYEGSVYRFLKKNQPKLIMVTDSNTNRIALSAFYNCAQRLNLSTKFCSNLVGLDYGNNIWDYETNADMISLRLFSYGSKIPARLRDQGWHGEAVCVLDEKMKMKYNRDALLRNETENLNSNPKILWAPGSMITGMFSPEEFVMANNIVLENAKKNGYEVIVKYHPRQSEAMVREIIQNYEKCENIKFVDQNCSIENCIDQADIVITTHSSVIFDASVKGKLVICIDIDHDINKEFVESLKDYFYFIDIEDIDFKKILYDLDFRKQQIEKQNAFYEEKCNNPDNVHMIDVLQRYV